PGRGERRPEPQKSPAQRRGRCTPRDLVHSWVRANAGANRGHKGNGQRVLIQVPGSSSLTGLARRRAMPTADELGAIARAIIDANLYLVLGTADASGQPW